MTAIAIFSIIILLRCVHSLNTVTSWSTLLMQADEDSDACIRAAAVAAFCGGSSVWRAVSIFTDVGYGMGRCTYRSLISAFCRLFLVVVLLEGVLLSLVAKELSNALIQRRLQELSELYTLFQCAYNYHGANSCQLFCFIVYFDRRTYV